MNYLQNGLLTIVFMLSVGLQSCDREPTTSPVQTSSTVDKNVPAAAALTEMRTIELSYDPNCKAGNVIEQAEGWACKVAENGCQHSGFYSRENFINTTTFETVVCSKKNS